MNLSVTIFNLRLFMQMPNHPLPPVEEKANLSLGVRLAYALPVTVTAFLLAGPLMVMPGIYAKHFGLSLSTIASVVLVAKLFDAVTDPIVGYCSDWYHSRTGSRKAFIISGGILFVISSHFLMTPPENLSTAYFLFWFVCFFLAWTLFEIPHMAWASEVSSQSRERTQLYSWRALMVNLGTLLFHAVPQLPVFATTEFTPQTLKWSVGIAAVMMPLVLYTCIRLVPSGQVKNTIASRHRDSKDAKRENQDSLLRVLFANKPFLVFVAALFFAGTGAGMWFALFFIFIDSYVGIGAKFSLVSLIGLLLSALSSGIWYALAYAIGKKWTWGLGMVSILIGMLSTAVLTPGTNSFFVLLIAANLVYFGSTSMNILAPSLLSDIIDYGTWKFGRNYAASYFSAYTLILKANLAIGGALGFAIAGWCGFDPGANTHTEENLFGLRLALVWVPASATLVALLFMALQPIDARRHAVICKQLEDRRRRVECRSLRG